MGVIGVAKLQELTLLIQSLLIQLNRIIHTQRCPTTYIYPSRTSIYLHSPLFTICFPSFSIFYNHVFISFPHLPSICPSFVPFISAWKSQPGHSLLEFLHRWAFQRLVIEVVDLLSPHLTLGGSPNSPSHHGWPILSHGHPRLDDLGVPPCLWKAPFIAMIWKNIVKPIDMIWYNYKLNQNNRSVWHRWYHYTDYTDSWCWCTLFIYYSASIISMINIDKQCTEVGASECPNSGTTHFIQFFAQVWAQTQTMNIHNCLSHITTTVTTVGRSQNPWQPGFHSKIAIA